MHSASLLKTAIYLFYSWISVVDEGGFDLFKAEEFELLEPDLFAVAEVYGDAFEAEHVIGNSFCCKFDDVLFVDLLFYIVEVVELDNVIGGNGIVSGLGEQCLDQEITEAGEKQMPDNVKDEAWCKAFVIENDEKCGDQQNGKGGAKKCKQTPE